ncbi:MAG: alkaline phosphatase D family protein [Planctomycetaceae bacterium]
MTRLQITSLVALCALSVSLSAQDPLPPPRPVPADHPLISRIAFGSCSTQNDPLPILKTVLEWEPELFIYLGDNIYGDTRDMQLLQQKYDRMAAKKEFISLRAAVPTIATWDDHDYGENDAGREFPFKAESKEIFLKFWNEPADSVRRSREGIYTSYRFTDPTTRKVLQIILLDTRTFRDPPLRNPFSSWKNDYLPDTNPEKTLLGETQWTWLEQQLREPADLRIIGSSIQLAHEYNGWESWTNFPLELMKMVRLISTTRANGVVFISGDVHWGELSVLKAPGCYPLYDLTASGLNRDWENVEPNRRRLQRLPFRNAGNRMVRTPDHSVPHPRHDRPSPSPPNRPAVRPVLLKIAPTGKRPRRISQRLSARDFRSVRFQENRNSSTTVSSGRPSL